MCARKSSKNLDIFFVFFWVKFPCGTKRVGPLSTPGFLAPFQALGRLTAAGNMITMVDRQKRRARWEGCQNVYMSDRCVRLLQGGKWVEKWVEGVESGKQKMAEWETRVKRA